MSSYTAGDACTHAGAVRLAHVIEAYWRKRGVRVKTRLVTVMESQQRQVFCIRSDLSGRV